MASSVRVATDFKSNRCSSEKSLCDNSDSEIEPPSDASDRSDGPMQECRCEHTDDEGREECDRPCCKNIGQKILKKQGWKEGQGLGKHLQGATDAPTVRRLSLGSSSSEEGRHRHGDSSQSDEEGGSEGRRLLECEKENTEELQQKYKDNQERERAIEESLECLKASLYCSQCNKQYTKYPDFENHIKSYDHAHVQRLRELKQKDKERQLGRNKHRDGKLQEKELRRISQFAEDRVERNSDSEELATVDVDSTTIFFDDATPNMPPLPIIANIMDSVCPEEIPLPPDYTLLPDSLPPDSPPLPPHHTHSSSAVAGDNNPKLLPSSPPDSPTSGTEKSTVSFSMSKKSANLIQGRSVFKASEEEERKARLPLLPRKKVSSLKKLVELKKEEAEKELSLEELYPSMPSANDDKPQHHRFAMKKFVKADQNLGGEVAKKVNPEGGEDGGNNQGVVVNGNATTTNGRDSSPVDIAEESGSGAIGCKKLTEQQARAIVKSSKPRHPDFVAVLGVTEDRYLEWPGEMVQKTRVEPQVVFSCNPLHFDFSMLLSNKPPMAVGGVGASQAVEKVAKVKSGKKKRRKKKKKHKSKDASMEQDKDKTTEKDGEKDTKSKSKKKKKRSKSKHKASRKGETDSESEQEEGNKTEKKSHSKRKRRHSKRVKKEKSDVKTESETKKNDTEKKPATGVKVSTKEGKAKTPVKDASKPGGATATAGTAEKNEEVKKNSRKRKKSQSAGGKQAVAKQEDGKAKKKKGKKKKVAANNTEESSGKTPAEQKARLKRKSSSQRGAQNADVKKLKTEPEDSGRVSDFEGVKDGGKCKWETSDDSELETQVKSERSQQKRVSAKTRNANKPAAGKAASTSHTKKTADKKTRVHSKLEGAAVSSHRSRKESEKSQGRHSSRRSRYSSDRSSSQDSYDSYDDDSYYSHSRSRSRSHRHHYSTDSEYTSSSRSYSRSYDERSDDSYDSYSSRSYSRSRSRSYDRRYSRSRSRSYSSRSHSRSYSRSPRSHSRDRRRSLIPSSPDPKYSSLSRGRTQRGKLEAKGYVSEQAVSKTISNNEQVLNKAKEMMDKIQNRKDHHHPHHHNHGSSSSSSSRHPDNNTSNNTNTTKTKAGGELSNKSELLAAAAGLVSIAAQFGPQPNQGQNIKGRSMNWLEGDRPRPEPDPLAERQRQELIEQIARNMATQAEEAEKKISSGRTAGSGGEGDDPALATIPIPKPTDAPSIPLPPTDKVGNAVATAASLMTTTTQQSMAAAGVGGPSNRDGGDSFIGPTQPGTIMQKIPLPKKEDCFQRIGPNDPLVFSKRGEDGEPRKPLEFSMDIPKEQEQKYKELQAQARKHMAKQRGEDVSDSDTDSEADITDSQKKELAAVLALEGVVTEGPEDGGATGDPVESPILVQSPQLLATPAGPQLLPAQLQQVALPMAIPVSQMNALVQAQAAQQQQAQLAAAAAAATPSPLAGAPVMLSAVAASHANHMNAIAQAQAVQQAQAMQQAQVQAVQQAQAQSTMMQQMMQLQAQAGAGGMMHLPGGQQVIGGQLVQAAPQRLVRVPIHAGHPGFAGGLPMQQQFVSAAAPQGLQQLQTMIIGGRPVLVRMQAP